MVIGGGSTTTTTTTTTTTNNHNDAPRRQRRTSAVTEAPLRQCRRRVQDDTGASCSEKQGFRLRSLSFAVVVGGPALEPSVRTAYVPSTLRRRPKYVAKYVPKYVPETTYGIRSTESEVRPQVRYGVRYGVRSPLRLREAQELVRR